MIGSILLNLYIQKNINNDLKKQILIMILESIVNDEKSGLISQLAELTYYFLEKNRNYASRVSLIIVPICSLRTFSLSTSPASCVMMIGLPL